MGWRTGRRRKGVARSLTHPSVGSSTVTVAVVDFVCDPERESPAGERQHSLGRGVCVKTEPTSRLGINRDFYFLPSSIFRSSSRSMYLSGIHTVPDSLCLSSSIRNN